MDRDPGHLNPFHPNCENPEPSEIDLHQFPKSGFENDRNYVCERHFEGYFRTISGLKFDGCHHPTLCIIPTVEYVKKEIFGYVKKIQKNNF